MSIETARREGGLLILTLNEPERRNPLSHAVRQTSPGTWPRRRPTIPSRPWC